jgi:ribosome-binding ATPase
MKLGIIGLSGSGKTTVFEALTHEFSDSGKKQEMRRGAIRVPDSRVDALSRIFAPQKTVYAQVEYFLPPRTSAKKDGAKDETVWTPVREADALIHVVRNFNLFGMQAPSPDRDFLNLDQELIFSDFVVVEKKLERMEAEAKKTKKYDPEEHDLLIQCKAVLEAETPLRRHPHLASARQLRGYAFLSAKPVLALFNNTDDAQSLPELSGPLSEENCLVIRGKLEHELAQMSDEESKDLLAEFDISASATDRVIQQSYELMGLISFFTVGEDEVRAWTIKKGTVALDAAEAIHTDLKKGFIRAEVISYDDFMESGSMAAAKKKGTFRLEGKTYEVNDGDIITIRFNI